MQQCGSEKDKELIGSVNLSQAPIRAIASDWSAILVMFGCLLCGQRELPRECPVGGRRAWLKCPDVEWSGRSDGRR